MTVAEKRMAGVCGGAVILACVLALAYVGAFQKPRPHHVPVAIVAPAAGIAEFQHALAAHAPGALKLTTYDSDAAALNAVKQRKTDGAVIVTGSGDLQLLVAGAGGTLTKQFLTETFTSLATTSHQTLTTTDVVPLPSHDSAGVSVFFLMFAALLPSLMLGIGGAVAGSGARPLAHAMVLAAGSVAIGLFTALIVDVILGALSGHFFALAGIVALDAFAVSSFAAALTRFKTALAGVALLLFLVIGMPASGGPSGMSQFVPGFYRWFGTWLPLPHAVLAATNTVYFGGHGIGGALLILLAWSLVGVALIFAHHAHTSSKAAKTPATS